MYLFLLFLIPCAYLYNFTGKHETDTAVSHLAYISGIFSGILSILATGLVLLFFPTKTTSFGIKFLEYLLTDTIIPFGLGITGLFFLLDTSLKQKLSNLIRQLFGIATVFLPYSILVNIKASGTFGDIWTLLFLPAMYTSILFFADYYLNKLVSRTSFTVNPIKVFHTILLLLSIKVLSDICKTLWFFCFPAWIYIILSILIVFVSFTPRLLKYRK